MKRSLIFDNMGIADMGITLEEICEIIPHLNKTEFISGLMITPLDLSLDNRVAEEIAASNNCQYGCVITVIFDNSRYYLFYGSEAPSDLPFQVTIGKEINGTLFLVSESSLLYSNSSDSIPTFTRRNFMAIAPEDIYSKELQAYDITEYEKVKKEYRVNIANLISTSILAFNYLFRKKLKPQEEIKEHRYNSNNKQKIIERFKKKPQVAKGKKICLSA